MQAPHSTTIVLLVLLPLIAWRVYSRIRRMVGRQRLSRVRPWITLAVFPTLIILLALGARNHPLRLGLLVASVAIGCALGFYGLRKTQFEPMPQGLFYTPNAHLGITLSLLFVARILYRLVDVYLIDPTVHHGTADFARSPLTLAVFGLLAGYYISYAMGLVRWRWRVLGARIEREPREQTL